MATLLFSMYRTSLARFKLKISASERKSMTVISLEDGSLLLEIFDPIQKKNEFEY